MRWPLASLVVKLFVSASLPLMCGCAVAMSMAGSRKNTSILQPGTPRVAVIAELGEPQTSTRDNSGRLVDTYSVTSGQGGSVGRAALHALFDIYTLGIWEIVGTPVEMSKRGRKANFQVTYDSNNTIGDVQAVSGGGGYEPISTTPISIIQTGSPKISVAGIQSRMLAGTPLGGYYDGFAKMLQSQLYAEGYLTPGTEAALKNVTVEEFKNAGYTVAGDSSVFGDTQSWDTRYLLGGYIMSGQLDVYGPLAGNRSEASLNIKWEVMDKRSRKVILTRSTHGSAETEGLASAALILAFRNAVRNLLADSKFVEAVVGDIDVNVETAPHIGQVVHADGEQFYEKLKGPKLIERIRDSVVTVVMEDGHGSGFLVSTEGHVITNAHVVGGRDFFDAILLSGIRLRCSVLYVDYDYDVAILKLEGSNFPALPLGDSNSIEVGQDVFAVGAPIYKELGQSVSKGIVSGLPLLDGNQFIQTDVKVSPGNSGGPLLNERGEVVGVITQKIIGGGAEGIGFALPINAVIEKLAIQQPRRD